MSYGARSGLAVLASRLIPCMIPCLALCLALGIPAASAQTAPADGTVSGGSWTDPPARRPEAAKPVPEAPQAAAPAPSPTPAAAPERAAVRRRPVDEAEAPPRTPSRTAVRRVKPAPAVASAPARPARKVPARKVAVRREPPVRARVAVRLRPVREARAPRTLVQRSSRVAAVRPPQDERFAGYRGYGGGYPPGYGVGYAPRYGVGYPQGYADDRMERLRAAEAAGYLVVRRRSVEYPDGRSLRTYRPLEDGGYD